FCTMVFLLMIPGFYSPGFFVDLGGLYVFGSLLCFALAHLAILGLRFSGTDLPRPFKIGWNFKLKGRELPVTALLGLVSTLMVWLLIIFTQEFSRSVGIIWMVLGLVLYLGYRIKSRLPIFSVPKKTDLSVAETAKEPTADQKS
ncbi:MAG TPA: hypothetical protein VJ488_01600, partial [Dehalococcoidia bacterium]|nr:hypothetical protein [Dehalococcoidia bacterium]